MRCPKCRKQGAIVDYYNFGKKKQPIFYCKGCIKFYIRVKGKIIQSNGS